MKKYLFIIALWFAFLVPNVANAVTCFWVGGTATWDTTNTGGGGAGGIKWASASGGGTTCAGGGTGGSPTAADSATFDGSSGGGTVTVNATISLQALSMDAFTGTLDFATNNNSVTLAGLNCFSSTGSATRTLNMGSNTWTLSNSAANWNASGSTNFTLNAGTSTLAFTGTGQKNFQMGATKTYATVTAAGGANAFLGISVDNSSDTIGTFTVSTPNQIRFAQGLSVTITTITNITASSAQQVLFTSSNLGFGNANVASGNNFTCTWCGFSGIGFTGAGTKTGTNSFDLGQNSGITITAPSAGGGGGRIIGG